MTAGTSSIFWKECVPPLWSGKTRCRHRGSSFGGGSRVVGILAGDHVSPSPGGDPTANKAAIFLVRVVKSTWDASTEKSRCASATRNDVRPAKGVAGGQGGTVVAPPLTQPKRPTLSNSRRAYTSQRFFIAGHSLSIWVRDLVQAKFSGREVSSTACICWAVKAPS